VQEIVQNKTPVQPENPTGIAHPILSVERIEDWIADGNDQYTMAPREHRKRRGDPRGFGLDEIRKHHDERALALANRQIPHERGIVRFHHARLKRTQDVAEGADRLAMSAGGEVSPNLAIEDHNADTIPRHKARECEAQRRVDRVIEFRSTLGARRHEPTRIERDNDGVIALVLVKSHDGPPSTCACRPIEAPRIVPGHIVAQRLEVHPFPASPRRLHAESDPHALRVQRYFHKEVRSVGVNPEQLSRTREAAATQQSERRTLEKDRCAERPISARGRLQRVVNGGHHAWGGDDVAESRLNL